MYISGEHEMRGPPPEGPHGHAEASKDGHVDLVGVQAHVDQEAGRLRVGEEHAVHRKARAVAHHHRRLLDRAAILQRVQNHLHACTRIMPVLLILLSRECLNAIKGAQLRTSARNQIWSNLAGSDVSYLND